MRPIAFLSFSIVLGSCSRIAQTEVTEVPVAVDSPQVQLSDSLVVEDYNDLDQVFDVVIADTGKDYRALEKMMTSLSSTLQNDIDSLGRTYDPQRDSIIVPLDSDDELYRGHYVPRRFPSNALSMEYLDAYMTAAPGTFALVTSISDSIASDSLLITLRRFAPKAFKVRTELWMGCMH
ncbi:MAG: hypothetical protein IPP83_18025 [Flavobacteriales bacterium]|nr:hypothetical protein [Flavobacteriales bacterium]